MNQDLNYQDQQDFKQWLGLNLHSISWEGRYLKEFEDFWDLLFPANIGLQQQFKKIDAINSRLVKGPLIAWLKWLKMKLVCFLFVHKEYSILELSEMTGMPVTEIALGIRNFMIERFPHLEELINQKFQIANILSPNRNLTYSELLNEFDLSSDFKGSLEDEVLTSLEVTLYSDWQRVYDLLRAEVRTSKSKDSKENAQVTSRKRFLFEVVILFVLATLLIFSIKVFNKYYEDYLVEKISLYSPDFFWLDKNLSFKSELEVVKNELEIKYNELEELEKIESKQVFRDISSTQRFEVESDVVLTSVETLPKDIATASLEQSEYEEVRKGGYRNVRYGRRKAYRVMMTSVDPSRTKKELIKLLEKYNVSQVDNVKPGTQIPGGIYFNIFVPTPFLKEFLSKVTSRETNATILESKTIYGGPPNRNRVFIWVKSI